MMIKIVMVNAFDRVCHNFLLEFLTKIGFHPSFIRWIKACISHPCIVPLINGRPTDIFSGFQRFTTRILPITPSLYPNG
jgi:hypothetical protein